MSNPTVLPIVPRLADDAQPYAVPLIESGGRILAIAGDVSFVLTGDQAVLLADALLEATAPEQSRAMSVMDRAMHVLGLS